MVDGNEARKAVENHSRGLQERAKREGCETAAEENAEARQI